MKKCYANSTGVADPVVLTGFGLYGGVDPDPVCFLNNFQIETIFSSIFTEVMMNKFRFKYINFLSTIFIVRGKFCSTPEPVIFRGSDRIRFFLTVGSGSSSPGFATPDCVGIFTIPFFSFIVHGRNCVFLGPFAI